MCQEKLAEENRRPVARYADKACFGDDADAASPCPVAFEDGCGIDEAAALELQAFHELLHPASHNVVIVLPLCIKADGWLPALGHEVHGEADDGTYAGHKEVGVQAHLDVPPHVVHLAAVVKLQPMTVAYGKAFCYRLCLGKSAGNKAQAGGLGFDVFAIQ